MENKRAVGRAIGKVILMGEHAVVYGQPALAIPYPATKIKTTISKINGPALLDCFFYCGLLSHAPERLLGLTSVIKQIVASFNQELKNFKIKVESSIPAERGIGSSAAVSVATIRALYDYFDRPLRNDDLLKWANVSEKIVHGNPSGLDAAIISGERALYYIKGQPFVPFHIKLDGYLIVADTGEMGQTRAAVADVRKLVQANPEYGGGLIQELGSLTNDAKAFIEENNIEGLGESMTKAHYLLDKLGVSNGPLNHLVAIALDNGASGAKLTGGGRGGCIIALASDEQKANNISNMLLSNGAKNTWISNMGVDLL